MNASALAAQAQQLRGLHVPGSPLLLVNAWDPPSARRLAHDGYPAIATTSAGVAEALGYEDGNVTPPGEMLGAVARIAAAVDVPVTADLEAGYGLSAGELVTGLLGAGAVGLNFEDTDHEAGGLVDAESLAERLAAIKQAGRDAGVDVVLNARVDVFVRGGELDEGVRRGWLYAEAGADCVYPIGVRGRDPIRRLVAEVGAPINVLVMPGGLRFEELAELGVARVSFGSGLMHTAMDAAARRAADYAAGSG
ncbi:MAG: isocitrate lyase/PEP mutase family protein [Candidatus Rokuibacteriota bacterium]